MKSYARKIVREIVRFARRSLWKLASRVRLARS